jgi:riboflavin synthase
MFTGIVETTGVVRAVKPTARSIMLTVSPGRCGQGANVGDSMAVNGCCLTLVGARGRGSGRVIEFDLLQETWRRTNFREVRPGSLVNLERSLRANARLGGHFVTGHIDGVGRVARWERAGQDWVLDVEAPAELRRYLVFKGSIAVDGISLTIAELRPRGFRVWIIPHTYEVTNLRTRRRGELVNLEADLVGKYVEQLLRQMDLSRR